jgi:hypothetical protein
MVVTVLHHLLLEHLFSMLVAVAAALNLLEALQHRAATAAVELETVETVLLLQQELQTLAVAVVAVGIREPLVVQVS